MKLRTKFLLSMAVVTTLLTAAAMVIVQRSVDVHARQEIMASFDNSTNSLREYQDRRETTAHFSADLLAETPALKAMMTTQDPATVQDASTYLWSNAGASLMALYGSSGKLLAVHNSGTPLSRTVVEAGAPARSGANWWLIGNRLYQIVIRPIESGSSSESNRLGTLVLGNEIDSQVVQQMARIADDDIAFRFHGRSVATSLSREKQNALDASGFSGAIGNPAHELMLRNERFLVDVVEPETASDGPEIIILKSYDQATVFMHQMNRLIMTVGAIVILLGAAVVFLISHTFTQPLCELVEGVRALGTGDFSYPLRTQGKDEVAELTSSFDGMRLSLQQSQERLVTSARLEAVGQLAGGVAHDFNNLITVIKGYAELLTLQIKSDDPLMKYADQISKAGDRASSLTRQLLAFSRKQTVEPQAVDLNLVVGNLQKMLRVLVGERYEIAFVQGPKLGRILADPGQIEQVVLNLVVNARDAMPDGGRIEIRTDNMEVDQAIAAKQGAPLGHCVRLSVIDRGCGMDEATQTKIFQPFFTTKDVGKGTGLGLSIVYSAVKQSGGFVDLESKLGEGSTFHIVVPQLESTVAEKPATPRKLGITRGTETILVVEDEDGVRNMIRDSLNARGFRVLVAHNGHDALRLLQDHAGPIDLVLADVVMPKLGGIDLAKQLKLSELNPKVLLMSGYSDRIIEVEDANLALLRKPFTADDLVISIQALLAQRERSEQLAPA